MTVSGPFLPDFEELLRFAANEIPVSDGLILIPGEDPFYFATGRVPQFPVLLFDNATDPYSPAQLVEEARRRNIHWLIVKRDLQLKEDPTRSAKPRWKPFNKSFCPTANWAAMMFTAVRRFASAQRPGQIAVSKDFAALTCWPVAAGKREIA